MMQMALIVAEPHHRRPDEIDFPHNALRRLRTSQVLNYLIIVPRLLPAGLERSATKRRGPAFLMVVGPTLAPRWQSSVRMVASTW